MNTVKFDLTQFPRFHRICRSMWAAYDQKYHETFKEHGFTTIGRIAHGPERWSMSEEEYTWFVLKWSD